MPIIVNKIITAIVEIIGPIELSAKQESASENVATTVKLRNAIPNAQKNRHKVSVP